MINAEATPRQVQQALERRAAGADLPTAIGLHPAADHVERLLGLATAVQDLPRGNPPPHSAAALRERFLVEGAARRAAWIHTRPMKHRVSRHPAPRHDVRWFGVVVLGVFLALIAGSVLSFAAMTSGPDGQLYPVRLVGEKVLLAATRDPASKAGTKIDLADQRFRDAEDMADKGRGDLAVSAMKSYYSLLRDSSTSLAAIKSHNNRWLSARDHFARTESKDTSGLEHQLTLHHAVTAAAQVAALQDAYSKARPDIDKQLGIHASSATTTIPVLGANQPSPSPTP